MSEKRKDKIADILHDVAQRARRHKARRDRGPVDRLPRFDVMLHAADRERVDEIVGTLARLTPMTPRAAMDALMLAHAKGEARLLSAHLEAAEFHEARLRRAGLSVSLRRAG